MGSPLATASQQIFKLLAGSPRKSFYVNELIRLTGRYPNSVQQALKNLSEQKLVVQEKVGRKLFYKISDKVNLLSGESRLESDETWVKLVNRLTSLAFNMSACLSNTRLLPNLYGVAVPTYWYNGLTGGVYYRQEELMALGKAIADLLDKDPLFAQRDIDRCRQTASDLLTVSRNVATIDLSTLSDRQLLSQLRLYSATYLNLFPHLTAPHAIERYFEGRIREQITDSDALEVVLSPVYVTDDEVENALKLATYARKNGFDSDFDCQLTDHWQRFQWLSMWDIHSQPLTRESFRQEILGILSKDTNPEEAYKSLANSEGERKTKLNAVLSRVGADKVLRDQIWFLQEYIFLRTYRKNILCQSHFYSVPLLKEVGARLKLTFLEVTSLSFEELDRGLNMLLEGKNDGLLREETQRRSNGLGLLMVGGITKVYAGPKAIAEAIERYRIVQATPAVSQTFTGMAASLGKVRGRVKVVRNLGELNKVEKGDVLVAQMTTPDYTIAMRKVVAIVTDEGGVTCHAAIVSREFGIPCIVGTHIATRVLNDGMMVEVDAFEGVVRVLESASMVLNVREYVGKQIYSGKVTGKARVVFDVSDLEKVGKGDILVTSQATPDYLSSLYRVGGFVVDEDSLTSHAVVYANALKLPSIMGTVMARFSIQDGEEVELDADHGVLRRLARP